MRLRLCTTTLTSAVRTGLALLAASAAGSGVFAQNLDAERDRQFRDAYDLLVSADDSREEGRLEEATILYRTTLRMCRTLSEQYPARQSEVVKFRIAYCESQIASIEQQTRPEEDAPPPSAPAPVPAADAEPPLDIPTPAPAEEPPATNAAPAPAVAVAPAGPTNRVEAVSYEMQLADMRRMLSEGRGSDATNALMELAFEDPRNTTTRMLLGIAFCQAGRHTLAIPLFEKLVEMEPLNPLYHVYLGTAYGGAGRTVDAVDATKDALALSPQLGDAHFNLAQLFMRLDTPNRVAALKHYRRAVELGARPDPALEARMAVSDDGRDTPLPGNLPPPPEPGPAEAPAQ